MNEVWLKATIRGNQQVSQADNQVDGSEHGRHADSPIQIPLRGWRDILLRAYSHLGEENLTLVAAGVAFYALFALAPGLTALVSVYALFASPESLQSHISTLTSLLPAEANAIIDEQLTRIVNKPRSTLGLTAVFSFAVALWSATNGMRAMMTAMNIVYQEREKRSFLRFNSVAIGMTIFAVGFVVTSLALIAVIPAVLGFTGAPDWVVNLTNLTRWPLLAGAIMLLLAFVFRYGPSRSDARWRWVTIGGVVSTLLALLASVGLSTYLSYFNTYNETYGSLGAVVILLTWFYISIIAVLIGALVNAEIEHQTTKDTTTGPDQPMGKRGAHVADTVGDTQ